MRVLVSGSRTWTDRNAIIDALHDLKAEHGDLIIVHGGARGADQLAEQAAATLGIGTEVWFADWSKGRGAGYARNAEMVKSGADLCLAFIRDNSRGASHCASLAEKAGIPVRRFTS